MKIEILEITAPELLELLSSMNYFDISKLLAEAVSIHIEKVSDSPALYKDVANELVAWCEPIVFNSDMVKDAISDSLWEGKHPYKDCEYTELDELADIADYNADVKSKELRGE